uniref:EF-hand domain-containing protein n=1 Tax=Hemiselmis andersenii TaxID=464988 RepID=A0A6T8HIY5_HEMAN|mmetsp:Transcript_18022/g.41699  ORF Transcript_18022/g.41699 Transcript_18022/m.41699 type:complete len:365 (+) Transcript_18022:40-1134(+)
MGGAVSTEGAGGGVRSPHKKGRSTPPGGSSHSGKPISSQNLIAATKPEAPGRGYVTAAPQGSAARALTSPPEGLSEDGPTRTAARSQGSEGKGDDGLPTSARSLRGKAKFRAALRAVIQERRLQTANTAGEKMRAAAQHQTEVARVARIRQSRLMASMERAAHTAMNILQSAAGDHPEVSPAERVRLQLEFDAFDRENTGLLPIKQLEKLLMKRAYLRCKNVWKEEMRRKHKTEMVSHSGTEEWFHYSSKNNMQDRKTATMAAKDAFREYACHGDGMDFESFCKFHASLGGGHKAPNYSRDASFDVWEEHLPTSTEHREHDHSPEFSFPPSPVSPTSKRTSAHPSGEGKRIFNISRGSSPELSG